MTVHNPKNLNLPPLEINRREDREKIESDPTVKSLIKSKLLLDKGLNQLLVFLLGETKKISRSLDRVRKSQAEYIDMITKLNDIKIKTKKDVARQKTIMELEKEFKETYRKVNQGLKKQINEISDKIQSGLDLFETKYETKLNILESSSLFICKNCEQIKCLDRFHSDVCSCGTKITKPSDYENISIHKLGENIINFIESNMWLEYGIDYLLRKKEFETLCGVHVIGHSGVGHEIDNIAEIKKDTLRIFCECKNTDININDTLIFIGKMTDIGCTRGYIFTTSFETADDIRRLAASKNITIIEQVLERDNDEIIKDIKEGN